MALTEEWERRIERWKNELKNQFYFPLGQVELKGFVTKEHLTAAQALQRNFKTMPPGTKWGAKWEYGWFKGNFSLPEEAAGEEVVLKVNIGAESAVFINGKSTAMAIQEKLKKRFNIDIRDEVPITEEAEPGAGYDILIEGYAGHGPRITSTGPVPPERESVPEPPSRQAEIGKTTFGIWAEDIYQLWLDVTTLFQIRENIPQESLRTAKIDEGLKEFTKTVDLEAAYEKRLETVREARQSLKPLLECKNGSTVPTMYTFGHSHLDLAWLWPVAETKHKTLRTFSTQLTLMERYPEYKFLQSQPFLYKMVEEKYPDLYKRIKKAVQREQIIPEGAMWVEADTNLSGGESLVRQFLYGKEFFSNEFGIDSKLCWLPDVFGYSGALPQIMKECGVDYFATQKILWAYKARETFPYSHFEWEGIDGSKVLAHIFNDYNAQTKPEAIINHWKNRNQKEKVDTRLYPFGWGDGGGGPTRDHLEYLKRTDNLEGVPKTKMSHPLEFFEEMEQNPPANTYQGELYFQAHRGTYTSQAKTKKGNRKSEFALREAEMWNSIALNFLDQDYPQTKLKENWKQVLLNQFHDILPGSSIERVYEEAEADYEEVINQARGLTNKAVKNLLHDPEANKAQALFNSLSWARKTLIKVPQEFEAIKSIDGQTSPVQEIEGENWAEIELPACGWITVSPVKNVESENSLKVKKNLLENKYLKIKLNETGEIESIYDKENDFEYAADTCNNFNMYKDIPGNFDAWDIDSMYRDTPVDLSSKADIEVMEEGPLAAAVKVTRVMHNSKMTQKIILKRKSKRVDFETTIDWQEDHKLLKVNFPVNIHTSEAISEIQFGHIKRPNHESRPYDKDQYEICNHKWSALTESNRGFALLNDSKYGLDADDNSLNLTLLKSAAAPDMNADKGTQKFKYSFYLWQGSFHESEVIQQAYDLNTPVISVPGQAGKNSVFEIDADNIIIESVKKAEDNSGDIIVRLYEAKKAQTSCTLKTDLDFEKVEETNMLEEKKQELSEDYCRVDLDFDPFEIKTIRFRT